MLRVPARFSTVLLLLCIGFMAQGCSELSSSLSQGLAPELAADEETTSQAAEPALPEAETPEPEAPEELVVEDLTTGTGLTARPGDKVTITYSGTLTDGTVVTSSDAEGPLTFTLGMGETIAGLSRGVTGMMVGGKRRLTIASHLAYGEQGDPGMGIPPDSTLIYEVELVTVHR